MNTISKDNYGPSSQTHRNLWKIDQLFVALNAQQVPDFRTWITANKMSFFASTFMSYISNICSIWLTYYDIFMSSAGSNYTVLLFPHHLWSRHMESELWVFLGFFKILFFLSMLYRICPYTWRVNYKFVYIDCGLFNFAAVLAEFRNRIIYLGYIFCRKTCFFFKQTWNCINSNDQK